jgi:hypothetical protein
MFGAQLDIAEVQFCLGRIAPIFRRHRMCFVENPPGKLAPKKDPLFFPVTGKGGGKVKAWYGAKRVFII